jgi:hypothetical protein
VVLAEGECSQGNLTKAAAITARYSDGHDQPVLEVKYRLPDREGVLAVKPMPPEEVAEWIIH